MQLHRCTLQFLVKTILQRPRQHYGPKEWTRMRTFPSSFVSVCIIRMESTIYNLFVLFCCLAMMTHYLFWYEKSTVYPIESVTYLHVVGEQTYRLGILAMSSKEVTQALEKGHSYFDSDTQCGGGRNRPPLSLIFP